MSFESGFIKRASEYGVDQYQAIDLLKTALEGPRKEEAKKYLPGGVGGFLGDYLAPGFQGYRAGKATALSKALGHTPGMATTNPRISSSLGLLGGGAAGGLMGHMAGGTANAGDLHGRLSGIGSTLTGTATGAILGALLPSLLRRRDMKHNLQEYASGAEINPQKPHETGHLANILLPLSGHHRKGEAVGYNKLRGIDESEGANTALNAAQVVPGPIGAAASYFGGIGQNYSANRTMNQKNETKG